AAGIDRDLAGAARVAHDGVDAPRHAGARRRGGDRAKRDFARGEDVPHPDPLSIPNGEIFEDHLPGGAALLRTGLTATVAQGDSATHRRATTVTQSRGRQHDEV